MVSMRIIISGIMKKSMRKGMVSRMKGDGTGNGKARRSGRGVMITGQWQVHGMAKVKGSAMGKK